MILERASGVSYLRISSEKIAKTVEFSDSILVDIDANEAVIGVELLAPISPEDLSALAKRFGLSKSFEKTLEEASLA